MNTKVFYRTSAGSPTPIHRQSRFIHQRLRWCIFNSWILLLLLLLKFPAVVLGQSLTFTTNDGTITITGGCAPVVVIPSATNGYRVTSIGNGAFEYCTSLTSVTIPDSVTNMGTSAFFGCSGLTNVSIGTGVTSVGANAFNSCSKLTSVTIPSGVTNIGDAAFLFSGLTRAYFKGTPPTVGNEAFLANDPFVTIYYLPGRTGWDKWVPPPPLQTVLWNPQLQNVAVQTNQFGFTITGTANIPIVVEACTNLNSGGWTALQTCTLTSGSLYFSDPQCTNYSTRIYRIRSP